MHRRKLIFTCNFPICWLILGENRGWISWLHHNSGKAGLLKTLTVPTINKKTPRVDRKKVPLLHHNFLCRYVELKREKVFVLLCELTLISSDSFIHHILEKLLFSHAELMAPPPPLYRVIMFEGQFAVITFFPIISIYSSARFMNETSVGIHLFYMFI